MLIHPHTEKGHPVVQIEPPVIHYEPIVSGPVTGHHWEEPGHIFFVPSFQVYFDEIPPEPSYLQAKQPHPLVIGDLLQTLNHFHGPLLEFLLRVHVSLVLGSPKLDTICQVSHH